MGDQDSRNLGYIVKEELKMLSQVKFSQLPSYQLGWEAGEIKGQIGLLSRRFGPLSRTVQARLTQATPEQLGTWADNILDAATLDDVFRLN